MHEDLPIKNGRPCNIFNNIYFDTQSLNLDEQHYTTRDTTTKRVNTNSSHQIKTKMSKSNTSGRFTHFHASSFYTARLSILYPSVSIPEYTCSSVTNVCMIPMNIECTGG